MEDNIKTYIKQALEKGLTKEEVAEVLRSAGWDEEKIKSTLSQVETQEIQAEPQEMVSESETLKKPEETIQPTTEEKPQSTQATFQKTPASALFEPKEEQVVTPSQTTEDGKVSLMPKVEESVISPPPQESFVPPSQFPQPPSSSLPSSSFQTQASSFSQPAVSAPRFDSEGRRLCPYCGTPLKPDAIYCPNCGKTVAEDIDFESKEYKDRKGFAVTSFVFGILAVLWLIFVSIPIKYPTKFIVYRGRINLIFAVLAILGIIFGFLGTRSSKKGLAIAGIILSFLFLILFLIAFLLAASLLFSIFNSF